MGGWFAEVSSLAHIPADQLTHSLADDVACERPLDMRVVWELAKRAARTEGIGFTETAHQ